MSLPCFDKTDHGCVHTAVYVAFFFPMWPRPDQRQCEQQKSHWIWSFLFRFGPLSYAVLNLIHIWFFLYVTSVPWELYPNSLFCHSIALFVISVSRQESQTFRWKVALKLKLILQVWMKSVSVMFFLSLFLLAPPLHPHAPLRRSSCCSTKSHKCKNTSSLCSLFFYPTLDSNTGLLRMHRNLKIKRYMFTSELATCIRVPSA